MITKEANAGLDALETRVLERELPGVVAAFDRPAMRDRLQAGLIGPNSAAKVMRCDLTSAILLDDCVVIRYELGLEDAGGEAKTTIVTCRVYPDAERASAYAAERLVPLLAQVRGRDEVSAFAKPVTVIESLGMVVYAYPIDGELTTLAAATDHEVAARAMEEVLTAAGRSDTRVESCRVEPVHYNRRHRCMLRYHLDLGGAGRQVLYGKVAEDGSGASIPSIVQELGATLARARVAVPECLGFREDLQLAVFTEIPGVPRVAQLLKARLGGEPEGEGLTVEKAADICGQIAAVLHTSGLRLGQPRPLEVELTRLRANLPPIQRLSPELGERLGHWLDVTETRAAASPALAQCQCHGDFSYTQLIFDGPRAGLVDFDNFCMAEPALDLGQFLAYLRYAGFKARGTSATERAGLTERLAERFTTSYTAAGGAAEALERVDVYEAVNLVRMAQHAWQNLKGSRLDHIVTVLDERLSL
jgi:aminoglycoside phosphotransferase (APT) family kinase protein